MRYNCNMFMHKRYVLVFALVFLLVSFFVLQQFRSTNVKHLLSSNTGVYMSESRECFTAIDQEIDVNTIVSIGDAYFGGEKEYDLVCARNAYAKAIMLDREGSASVWYQLGRINFLEGYFDEAISNFEFQIEYFGDALPNVYYMLGLTYGYRAQKSGNVDDWMKAEEAFKTFITYDPEAPWPHVDLAWIYFSQGKYTEMRTFLEDKVKFSYKNPWVYNVYGLALLNTGEKALAHQYFTEALEEALKMDASEWGRRYPGNDPRSWEQGLSEMKKAIEHNVEISSAVSQH